MSRWSASLHLEMSRLGFSEADWKLPSHGVTRTRTRHGGHGRPDLRRREKEQESTSESEDSEWSRGGSEESTTDEDLDLSKPPSTRVIVEVEGLKKTFRKELQVPQLSWQCIGHFSNNLLGHIHHPAMQGPKLWVHLLW